MAYVYRHYRNDTKEVFYVGIGKTKNRYASRYGRNKHWRNIANKHGFSYEIIYDGITWDEACELEELLIQEYGRRDIKSGNLVNMTDGGEGVVNLSKDSRKILAEKIKQSKYKILLNVESGIYYTGFVEAAESVGIKMPLLHKYIRGTRNNKTYIRLTDESSWIDTPYKEPVRKGGKPKEVINIYSGIVYESVSEAARQNNMSQSVMLSIVQCKKKASSDFAYANQKSINKRHKLNIQ